MLIENTRINDLTHTVLASAIEVHRVLGPGLLESIYATCLQFELASRGLRFAVQQPVPLVYKTLRLEAACRVDLTVEDLVIVEIKSVDATLPVHQAQVVTYLRLTGCAAGLLINFNVPRLMDGVKRLLNTEPASGKQRG